MAAEIQIAYVRVFGAMLRPRLSDPRGYRLSLRTQLRRALGNDKAHYLR